jgi:ubiquinone/menaquinone biosynthesis C-methylase UbiE
MTNVTPWQLNYDKYTSSKYDRDIVNAIPFHRKIHELISKYVAKKFNRDAALKVLDLGVGTGITAKVVQDLFPNAEVTAVDFSRQMLNGARKRLGDKNVSYVLGDYSKAQISGKFDLVLSVIGLHHQDTTGKKRVFKKVFSLLKGGGVFVFGDLVTYKSPDEAAYNNALHFNHLVEHASDKKTLKEWAHHHMFLNDLAAIEEQIFWLKKTGFKVKKEFLQMNTALLIAEKR